MVLLMMNPRFSKQVEDRIKHTFENCAFRWIMFLYVSQCTMQKTEHSNNKALRSHDLTQQTTWTTLRYQGNSSPHNHTFDSVIGTLFSFGNERASARQILHRNVNISWEPKFHTCELLYLNILTMLSTNQNHIIS
jgi:hypothetical protein